MTLTVKVDDTDGPSGSVAVQVTVVVPTGKTDFEAGVQPTGTELPVFGSLAVGPVNDTGVPAGVVWYTVTFRAVPIEAANAVGASQPVGQRRFRNAGGMAPFDIKQHVGRQNRRINRRRGGRHQRLRHAREGISSYATPAT
jgi:hypothetical protein